MTNILVLTGAGISAPSGLSTFRDSGGLWENFKIEEVCTAEALKRDPKKVNEFYHARWLDMLEANPNPAHFALATLAQSENVLIVTQNVDNLHERAGSPKVLHLHGKLDTILDENFDWVPRTHENSQKALRPDVVLFNEDLPSLGFIKAQVDFFDADELWIVGTTMAVGPANSFPTYAQKLAKKRGSKFTVRVFDMRPDETISNSGFWPRSPRESLYKYPGNVAETLPDYMQKRGN